MVGASPNDNHLDGFIKHNEAELDAFAKTIVAPTSAAATAGAASALIAKILTGSSTAAGAAEHLTIRVLGEWLADVPDERLRRAALAYKNADTDGRRRREFAQVVHEAIGSALLSVEMALRSIVTEQRNLNDVVSRRSDGLEDLLFQALRGQAEVRALVVQVLALVESGVAKQFRDTHKIQSPTLVLWKEKLAFLEAEEVKLSDPAQRFTVHKTIEEAKARIRELEGTK